MKSKNKIVKIWKNLSGTELNRNAVSSMKRIPAKYYDPFRAA